MQYGQNQKRSQPVSTQLERGVCSKKHKAKTRKGKKKNHNSQGTLERRHTLE